MPLKLIKLKDHNVHVRYSIVAGNITFNQARYTQDGRNKNPAARVDITLWVKSSTHCVAFDTEQVMQTLGKNREWKDCVSIHQYQDGYKADGIDIESCVLATKSGKPLKSRKRVGGLGKLVEIALSHAARKKQRSFFKDASVIKSKGKKHPDTIIYEIKGGVDPVDKDHLRKKKQEDKIERRIKRSKTLTPLRKKRLAASRQGQGYFRQEVRKQHNDCCLITGIKTLELLIASHIKPWGWQETTDDERLDPHNGLLLAATYDKLFDKGFITFDEKGALKISPQLPAADRKKLFPDGKIQRNLSPETQGYLEYHRKKIFKKR